MADLLGRFREPIHPDSLPILCKDLLHCHLGGDAAILDPRTGIYYGLNRVGARIWDHIAGQKTVAQIERDLIEEFDVEPAVCSGDLSRFLKRMADSDLVRIEHAAL